MTKPDEVTWVSLLVAFHRGDRTAASAILADVMRADLPPGARLDSSLTRLLVAGLAWHNAIGQRQYGAEGWGQRLQAFLLDAAARKPR